MALVLPTLLSLPSISQTGKAPDELTVIGSPPPIADLRLGPVRLAQLNTALTKRDYKRAEAILLEEIEQDPKSERSAKLLIAAGHIFFLDGEYLNSAIAWQKAQAIAPLDNQTKFSLAMAYIRLNQNNWAQHELHDLSSEEPKNALYLYWLGRMDYDAGKYESAITKFQRVTVLDPDMMRGYYSLGLCYDYLGRLDEAIQSYNHAIELNRKLKQPTPWPHLDLAISFISLNRLPEAEAQLREALTYDSNLPSIHYQLGIVFEREDRTDQAITSFEKAAELDPNYPEPHYSLGRIYQRQGKKSEAQKQIDRFKELRKHSDAVHPQ